VCEAILICQLNSANSTSASRAAGMQPEGTGDVASYTSLCRKAGAQRSVSPDA